MEENSEKTPTVKLNVGGKLYQVSTSLIESYPDSMLARLISDTWTKDTNTPIFIESDGVQFQYVLQCICPKKVHLPASVSKAAILQDLDYFGLLQDIQSGDVCDGCGNAQAARRMVQCKKMFWEEKEKCDSAIKELNESIKTMEKKKEYLEIAHFCFQEYSKTGKLEDFFLSDHCNTNYDDERTKARVLLKRSPFYLDLFQECMALYGLKYDNDREDSSTRCEQFSLSLLEVTTPEWSESTDS